MQRSVDAVARKLAEKQPMTQYAVLIFEGAKELPAEVLAAHGDLPGRIAEKGGRIVAGLALPGNETATAIRGEEITDGPFIETKEALAGVFVLEARDLDHAIALAELTPIVDGGVEVRPLLGFHVLEDS
ncbi:YciI family protein [Amycolatopsis taiwanensis]|uniref:YciI family protein n=1 Tax=Amycolatopsis taiwanensis TaxID=342230 RepID=UPI0004BC7767|nr:YciI family protein [Amycolatopsis taiwanensis]